MNDNNTHEGPSNRVPPLAPGSAIKRLRAQLWRHENCAERFCDNATDVAELMANRDAILRSRDYWVERALDLRALAVELLDMVEEYHACDWDEEPFTPDIDELRARIGSPNGSDEPRGNQS